MARRLGLGDLEFNVSVKTPRLKLLTVNSLPPFLEP